MRIIDWISDVCSSDLLSIFPDGFSTDVWMLLLQHPNVQRGIFNSVWMTATSVCIGVFGTALMAWGMSRPNLPGRRLIFILVLITIVFEPGIKIGRASCRGGVCQDV